MSTETIHTALLGIARGGDDSIPLADDLSLVRPNDQLLAHRWDWVQGQGEIEEEAEATRYLVCEYPQWVQGEGWGAEPMSASPVLHSFSLYPAAVQSSAANRNCPYFSLSQRRGPLQSVTDLSSPICHRGPVPCRFCKKNRAKSAISPRKNMSAICAICAISLRKNSAP